MSIRVLLADDHKIVLEGLRNYLGAQRGVEIVGEAVDGRQALDLTWRCRPDVVVIDVTMPGMNGVDVTGEIRRRLEQTRICALTMHADRRHVRSMLAAGATGYIVKSAPFEQLLTAVRAVAAGETYLCPEAAESLGGGESDAVEEAGVVRLSEMDRQVLQLVAEGLSSKEIAPLLHVTKKTVDYHRQTIMNKLDIRTVAGLTKFAVRQGMTPLT